LPHRLSPPVIFLLICILAFGMLIPLLGFYWDDWFVIFYTQAERAEFLYTHYSYDRPYSTWTAWLGGALLGSSPALWQVATLLIRWLAILALWWALRALWPRRAKALAWLALLFAVYPAYYLQPISVALSQHWIAYALFFLSLGAMGWAQRRPEQARVLTALGLAAALLHLGTLEYFAGLELIRPFYIALLLAQSESEPRQKLRHVLRAWAPYLGLWIAWVLWRMLVLELPEEPHPPQLLLDFMENPQKTWAAFAPVLSGNLQQLLLGVWPRLGQVLFMQRNYPFHWVALFAGGLTAGGLYFLSRHALTAEAEPEPDRRMALGSIAMGFFSILVGLLPIWLIGEDGLGPGYNERFALPGMLGAALIWMGLLWLLLRPPQARAVLLSAVLGLLVAGQVRGTEQFIEEWREQQAYFEQLKWRAPAIAPNTAFIIYEPVSNWMPNPSSTSVAVNTLYAQSRSSNEADFWFFETRRSARMHELENGKVLARNYRGLHFRAENADSLLFLYKPQDGCLWLLRPLDIHNAYLPEEQRDKVALANLGRIQASSAGAPPPEHIFGDLEADNWCYYFEKADLARQVGQWGVVLDLMDAAQEQGYAPSYGIEWLPLLEAHAQRGDWAAAEALSSQIHTLDAANDSMLCALWDQLRGAGNLGEEGLATRRAVREFANCE